MSLISIGAARGRHSTIRVKRPGDRRSVSRSATRALDVMELFGSLRRPLRAIEIGSALAVNPSTVHQLLKTMVDSGHLVFDARGKTYLPSPRLGEFSSWIVDTYGAGGRLHRLIHDVQARTGMVVTVTTPNDLFMQIIDSAFPASTTAERGLQIAVFGSAIGSAYLSTIDDSEVVRLAERARFSAEESTRILEMVAPIRRDGFADGSSGDKTVWSIAIPLPLRGLSAPTVLGLAGPTDAMRANSAAFRQIMAEEVARWLGETR